MGCRLRPRLSVLLGLVLAVALVAAACGSSGSAPSGSPGATSTSARPSPGGGPPLTPDYAALSSYEQRCNKISATGAFARVIYQPRQDMTRGDSAVVTAAVTLTKSVPPQQILGRRGAEAAEPGIIVSCIVEAELTGSTWDFNLPERDWVERSLVASDTARWSWYVGPKLGGTHPLTLRIRPIVRASANGSNVPLYASAEKSHIVEYQITARVKVPLSERIPAFMSWLAASLKVAQGTVEAVTGVVLALVSLGGVLGFRRRRTRAGRTA